MVSQVQSYPEYRNSGIEWLGKVPSDWLIFRMDDLTDTVRDQIDQNTLSSFSVSHYSIPSVQQYGMGLVEDGQTIDSNKFIVAEGDVLFSKLNPRKETITIVQRHEEKIVSSTEFVVLRPKSKTDARFVKYLLHAQQLKTFICSQVESATKSHQRVNPSVVSKLKFFAPNQKVRSIIANFLDHETAKIDTLIDKQQQLIKLLKEKRQAVISQVVTKGLNPDAPMKDSGVEWLGAVPEGWDVTKLKYLATKMKAGPFGSALKQDVYVSKGYRVYGQEQVIPANFSLGDYYIDQNKYDEMSQYKVEPGDLLISCVGTFGKIAIFPKNAEPGIINPRLIKITPDTAVIPEYLEAVLKSSVIYEQLSLLSRGGTMDVINIGILSEIVIPTPSIDEQLKLLDFYNINTLKFVELVNKANSQIDFLQERRTALISAAVTGKIDVRNWVPGK
jgi:type I restriction enzyme S subunit